MNIEEDVLAVIGRSEARANMLKIVYEGALTKEADGDIRNSIIGTQWFNAYPMVAALNEAGFTGLDYAEARKNVGTLLERAAKAEATLAPCAHARNKKIGIIGERWCLDCGAHSAPICLGAEPRPDEWTLPRRMEVTP